MMNKTIHGLIAAFFGIACCFLWGILSLASMLMVRASDHAPAFTQLCVGWKPLLVVLPLVGVIYCVYVWIRKNDGRCTWQGFFAGTMATLMLVMLPTLIACWLPVVQFIELSKR
jgi:hypothetical protein